MHLEEVVLKVGVQTEPASFAGAIYKNIIEGKAVVARAFGASANYTMAKGIAIAQEYFRSHGMDLLCQFSTRKENSTSGRDIRSFTANFYVKDDDGIRAIPIPERGDRT